MAVKRERKETLGFNIEGRKYYILKDRDKVTRLFSIFVTDKWFHVTFAR